MQKREEESQKELSSFPEKLDEITLWNTTRCNFRCKYCFVYKLYEDQPSRDFTDTLSLVDFAAKNLSQNGTVWFFGGEPLVSFDSIKSIVEAFSEAKLSARFGLTTNLSLLDEEKTKYLAKHNFGILCSIDGSPKTHNKFRVYPEGGETWPEVWEGLRNVRLYITSTPGIRFSIAPPTVSNLVEDIKFLIKEGLTSIAADPVYEVKWGEEDLLALRKELEAIRELSLLWYRRNIPVSLKFIRDGIFPAQSPPGQGLWRQRCGLGTTSVGVDTNGDIFPCHRFVASHNAQIAIGNLSSGFSEKRADWMKAWLKLPPFSSDPSLCKDCIVKSACMGACLAVNYDMFDDFHVVPEAFCRIQRIYAEVFMPLYLIMKGENNPVFSQQYQVRPVGKCIE